MANPTDSNTNWPDPEAERAQPGDVLGIERGGETTSLGDTAEDEDRRRHAAEEDAPAADDDDDDDDVEDEAEEDEEADAEE